MAPRTALIRAAVAAAIMSTVWAQPARAALVPETPIGSTGSLDGQMRAPQGVALQPDGTVVVADTGNNRLQAFDRAGTFIARPWPTGLLTPMAVVAEPTGALLVLDSGNSRIVRVLPDGSLDSAFDFSGGPGAAEGRLSAAQGLATDRLGRVYVADTGNDRVQVLDPSGAFDHVLGVGVLSRPRGVAVGFDGTVYVSDAGHSRVLAFDPISRAVSGTIGAPGMLDGQFVDPAGIAVDDLGRVVVSDSATGRVQRFRPDDVFLDAFGGPGQLAAPAGIAANAIGVVVADAGNDRVLATRDELPPPTAGETANLLPVKGAVNYRPPGSTRFLVLLRATQVRVGTEIDAADGRVQLQTARSRRFGDTQSGRFYSGRFRVTQPTSPALITDLVLAGGNFSGCQRSLGRSARKGRKKRGRRLRRLWGDTDGATRTTGRDATATVKGTRWLTEDFCGGTLVTVREGTVIVRPRAPGGAASAVSAPRSRFVPHG